MITSEQIELYCKQKEEEKTLKKSISDLNSQIKEELLTVDDKKATFGKYTVNLEGRENTTVDEAKMISIIKTFWDKEHPNEECPLITTKVIESVNDKELESFIYNEKISEDVLADIDGCIKTETSYALKYKILKEDK